MSLCLYHDSMCIHCVHANYMHPCHFVKMESCQLEQFEKLEQLRAMWYGTRIHVAEAQEIPGPGVDTAEDLEKLNQLFSNN